MIRDAFLRFDEALTEAGGPGLDTLLAPSIGQDRVASELLELRLHRIEEANVWFGLHNGGWIDAIKHEFFSLAGAIEHRRLLSMDLLVPFESSWMPLLAASTESTVLDTATGKVLRYDLESGATEATEAAASLERWLDDFTSQVRGSSGNSGSGFSGTVGRTWSGGVSISSIEDLENEARRALRGIAGLARRSARWIEAQEGRLAESQQRRAESPSGAPEHDEKGHAAVTQQSGMAPQDARAHDTKHTITPVVPSLRWEPPQGEVDASVVLNDERIVAAVKHDAGASLYVLDPGLGLRSTFLADVPEGINRYPRGMVASPVTPYVLVNGSLMCNIDAMTVERIEGLVEARSSYPQSAWSADGSTVRVKNGDLVRLYSLESGVVRTLDHAGRFVGSYVVASVPTDDGRELRVETFDGAAVFVLSAKSHGFTRAMSRAVFEISTVLLSPDGTYLAVNVAGARGFVLINLAQGTFEKFDRPRAELFSADGSVLFAIEADYPTSECLMIHLPDGRLEPFGDVHVEDAKFDLSADGTKFVHHAVVPDRKLGLEYIDWTLGVRSTLPMCGQSHYDVAVAVKFGEDCVIYYDERSSGDPSYFVAPIRSGQLGEPIDVGTETGSG